MGKVVVALIIILPIVWFCIRISTINREYEPTSGDLEIVQNEIENISNEYINLVESGEDISEETSSEESGGSKYGNPISKLIEGAKINTASANVYQEPDDASSLVGAVYKDMTVTVQDYPNGWSNIKYGEGAGWIKTEYVTKPDENGVVNILVSAVGKKATVLVDALNVRESAVNGTVIDAVHLGDELNIIGANEDETWFQVQYGTKSGWVSGKTDLVKVNY